MQGETCKVIHLSQEDGISHSGKILLSPDNPESMEKLLLQILGTEQLPCKGVVHLWSLDTTPTEETTISSLEKDQMLGLTSTLQLIQALKKTKTSVLPPLWIVTRGAQKIGSETALPAIAQAPIWGLGRSLSMEMPSCWGGLVDLDREFSTTDAAKALFEQLWYQDGESQIALRSEHRYVARLMPSEKIQIAQPLSFDSDVTYLITGGNGHLGLNTARWMVDKGARHIVLVGRTDASSTARQAIGQLEDLGTQVLVVKADISVRGDVERIFEEIKDYCAPLRGIFHAAGISSGFHSLEDMTPELLESVLAPKVVGTWNLHQMTLGMKLDFFVCISSITSIWGSEGLADYAAANHFLDIFAHYRHSLKLPALTVNVGALSGGGMHYQHQELTGLQQLVNQIGLKYYSPQELLKTVEYSLEIGVPQQAIVDIDWTIFKQLYEARERRTLLKKIDIQLPKPLKQQLGQVGEVLQKLKDAPPSERYDFLVT